MTSAVPLGAGGNATSSEDHISEDGRFVVFTTNATNIVPGGVSAQQRVVVADRVSGGLELISVNTAGDEANGLSSGARLSSDGRFVVFVSGSSNLGGGSFQSHIYLRDRQLRTTVLISANSSGLPGNGASSNPSVSGDGRYVAFLSSASNLVSGDTNNVPDVFVRDVVQQTTVRINVDPLGGNVSQPSSHPVISSDGRFVAFDSVDGTLVPNDTNAQWDIFVRDLLNQTTERVSVDSAGIQVMLPSTEPSISADGRFISFSSYATNLVPADTNNQQDIFVRDRLNGTTERVSVNSGGIEGVGSSFASAISGEGRFVAFESASNNLAVADNNVHTDVFLHDRSLHTTIRVNLAPGAVEGNADSTRASVCVNGLAVAYTSSASNLISNDVEGNQDVFAVDLASLAQRRLSQRSPGAPVVANHRSSFYMQPALSSDGRFVAFMTTANNLQTPPPCGGSNSLCVVDRWTGTLNMGQGGCNALPVEQGSVSISDDGRFAVFAGSQCVYLVDRVLATMNPLLCSGVSNELPTARISRDGNYVVLWSGQSSNQPIQLFDRLTGTFTIESTSTGGLVTDTTSSRSPQLSSDGRYIVFSSSATSLVPGDTNGFTDIFFHDHITTSTARISIATNGAQANADCTRPWVSGDGRFIVFESTATNLVDNDTNGTQDIFIRDRTSGTTTRVNVSTTGDQANQWSGWPTISSNGRYVAYYSLASNLVPGDTNRWADVFVRDLVSNTTHRASVGRFCEEPNGDSAWPSAPSDSGEVSFVSFADNLVSRDTNAACDVFVRSCPANADCGAPLGTVFCAGDNSATPCPCGNVGLPGRGCYNSLSTGGCALAAEGHPSVSEDSLRLVSIGLIPHTSALVFQGTAQIAGGNGAAFGDGLRCVGGVVLRLAIRQADAGGNLSLGFGVAGDPRLAIAGAIPIDGATRHYQVWYRNSAPYCQPEAWNLSNGLTIDWTY